MSNCFRYCVLAGIGPLLVPANALPEPLAAQEEYYTTDRDGQDVVEAQHIAILRIDRQTGRPLDDVELRQQKEKAYTIFESARAGEDFDMLVENWSEDLSSIESKGCFRFHQNTMLPEFDKWCFEARAGDIGFVTTSEAFHIIRLNWRSDLKNVPEFKGVFMLEDEIRYLLSDPVTEKSSGWISAGETFMRYRVAEFHAEENCLFLIQDTIRVRCCLQGIVSGESSSDTVFIGKLLIHRGGAYKEKAVKLMEGTESLIPLGPGESLVIRASRRPDGTIAYFTRCETDSSDDVQIVKAPCIIAHPEQGFSLSFDPYVVEMAP